MTMSAAPAETISGTKRMLITVCVMIATLLQTLDNSVNGWFTRVTAFARTIPELVVAR